MKFKLRALTGFQGDRRKPPSTGRNGSSIPQAVEFSDGIALFCVICFCLVLMSAFLDLWVCTSVVFVPGITMVYGPGI